MTSEAGLYLLKAVSLHLSIAGVVIIGLSVFLQRAQFVHVLDFLASLLNAISWVAMVQSFLEPLEASWRVRQAGIVLLALLVALPVQGLWLGRNYRQCFHSVHHRLLGFSIVLNLMIHLIWAVSEVLA